LLALASLEQCELFKILDEELITPVYQPIVNLKDGSILGYEALSRGPKNSLLANPDLLFKIAAQCEQSFRLDSLCRKKAIKHAHQLPADQFLFLNVDPQILEDKHFHQHTTKKFLADSLLDSTHIIFELTEKNLVEDYSALRKTLKNYEKQGYSIAIDDVGSGYSGLTLLTKINPQFLKIDLELIQSLHKDKIKQAIVKSLLEIATIKSMEVIAEGIETKEDLECAAELGIHYGQGYYLGMPQPVMAGIALDRIECLKKKPKTGKNQAAAYFSTTPLAVLPKGS
jgi:EAL domain-containing protein (putative c-di-GMP-specific phosphodiesterase class I)